MPRTSRARIEVAARAVVLTAVLLSGCGGDEDEGAIHDVMKGYYRAALEADRAKACSYLTKAAKEAAGEGCLVPNDPNPLSHLPPAQRYAYIAANERAMEKVKVKVDGDTAKAGSWVLRKENGEWRVEPPGEPAEGPTAPEYGRH